MIEIKQVTKKFDDLVVLNNVSFTIPEGEIFGIVGKSGAGKSTLLRCINRLESVDEGSIIVDGVDVGSLEGKKLREYRKNVGMIFQQFSLLETQTVYNNIALPLKCNGYKKAEIDEKVKYLASIVGLTDKLKNKPRELSGGQKQRVAIARSLTLNPKILLCDEATSALDPVTTASILELLKDINKKLNITIVIVTHQMEVIKSSCDEICLLEDGEIVEIGKTDELFLSPKSNLKNLINEQEIIPSEGVNIKLYFPKTYTGDSLITTMARKLNVDFSIVWGKLERFKDDVLGTLIINCSQLDALKIEEFIQKTDVKYEILGGER